MCYILVRYFAVAEVGSEVGGGGVRLPGLLPRHCVIAHTEGVVTGQSSSVIFIPQNRRSGLSL
jgi:hypothetical protein